MMGANNGNGKIVSLADLRPALTPIATPAHEKEACICGGQKHKTATFTDPSGQTKTIPVLVCASCSEKFKAYQHNFRVANARKIAADQNAPDEEPANKFQWVLNQIDLDKFEAEDQVAETTYRTRYDEVVIKVLAQRGYLVGTPEWKGIGTSRPANLRFTQEAYGNNGTGKGPVLQEVLEENLKDSRWAMKQAANRLSAGRKLKASIEARLAATPAPEVPDDALAEVAGYGPTMVPQKV